MKSRLKNILMKTYQREENTNQRVTSKIVLQYLICSCFFYHFSELNRFALDCCTVFCLFLFELGQNKEKKITRSMKRMMTWNLQHYLVLIFCFEYIFS